MNVKRALWTIFTTMIITILVTSVYYSHISYKSTTGTVISVSQETFPYPHTVIRFVTFSESEVTLVVYGMTYFTPHKTYTIITRGNFFQLYPRVISFTEL